MKTYRTHASGAVTPLVLMATGLLAAPAFAQFTFSPAANIPLPTRPDGIVAADLNGDGRADIAMTRDTPDRLTVLIATGGGAFAAPVDYPTGGGTGPGVLTAADLDGDGDPDLAVALKNTNSVRVYANNGVGGFAAGSTTGVGTEPRAIAAARLNADASIDLVTGNRESDNITILINNGSASFTATHLAVGEEPRGVAAADLTGDTHADLAVTNHRDRNVALLINDGSGGFTPVTPLSVGTQVRPDGIVAADLNNDGAVDLAVATSSDDLNQVAVFMNAGSGVFAGPTNYPTGGLNPSPVVAADLDCDGLLDLAAANQGSGDVAALRNTGGGVFGAAQLMVVGSNPGALAAGDVDRDGDLDLATSNQDSDNVSVLLNQTCFPRGDMNCDGVVDFGDINPFVKYVTDCAGWQAQYVGCPPTNGDIDQDGQHACNGFLFDDINAFVALLSGGA